MPKTSVLIAGRDASAAEAVRHILQGQPDLQVSQRGDDGAQVDPLLGLAALPDVLIVALGSRWEETLRALAARPAGQRPPMIVVGPNDAQVMRRAMQAGARDFFSPPVPANELLQALRMILREKGGAPAPESLGTLTAVVNAKGGSGASFIAANLAHLAAVEHQTPVGLLDLDLQFGALPLVFDLEQRNSLLDALNASDQLDTTALQGYMAKHPSGVHVLSAMTDQVPLPWEIPSDALTRLLTTMRAGYAGVVADLPRQIDPLTGLVLSQATSIIIVMQQSLAHIRDAKRMLRIVTHSLGVPRERVLVVVNRYNERDAVQLKDIEETLRPPAVATLPNDFRAVSESLNTGVPVADFDKGAVITKGLQELAQRIQGEKAEPPRKRGLRAALTGTWGGK